MHKSLIFSIGVLRVKLLKEGVVDLDGTATPKDGARVSILYVGTFLDGKEFDSNRGDGAEYSKPLSYTVGSGSLISGMDIAIKSMQKGEKSLFRFRADYAYGEVGCPGKGSTPTIEKNQTIQFEIELVDSVVLISPAEIRAKEDEARLVLLRSEREIKAKLIEEQNILKQNKIDEKKKKDVPVVIESDIVFDKKWAKGLKPKDLKDELKKRNLSLQGNKNDLLSRLLETLTV